MKKRLQNLNIDFRNILYVKFFSKKNIIKIPKDISVFFCENNVLVIKGNLCTKAIKLKTQIKIFNKKKIICITPFIINSYKRKKILLCNNTSYVTQIKHIIKKTFKQSKKKLKIVGVGYKVVVPYLVIDIPFIVLQLKLGYSHFIYVKIPKNFKVINPKPNKLFFYGFVQQKINIISFLIKSYKMPEPYKVKGIYYFHSYN